MSTTPKQRLAASLGVVLAATLLWLWASSSQGATIGADPGAGERDSGMLLRSKPDAAEVAPTRSETDTNESPPAKTVVELAHIRGRCLARETGQPLAGCKVELEGWGRGSSVVARHPVPKDWKQPEAIETAADGRFDFAFDPPAAYQWSLEIAAEGRVPRTGRWGLIEPGSVDDLGDIEVSRGYRVRGTVVDRFGAPVAKAGVRVENLPLPIRSGMAANNSRNGTSDEHGRFEVRVPVPAGTWSIEGYKRGYRHVTPDVVVVEEGAGAPELRVVIRRMPSISGIVVDELGQPAARVNLEAKLSRWGRIPSAWTHKDGTFAIYAVDEKPEPVQLEIYDPGEYEPKELPETYAWGTRDVRIELRRAVSVDLTVVEKASGKPVEDFAVACWSMRSHSSLQRNLRLGGRHEGGAVTVDKVWRGKSLLQVFPSDAALLPSEQIELEASDAGAPAIRVELERMQRIRVRVLRHDRTPVSGTRVELIRPGTVPLDPNGWVAKARRTSSSTDPKFRLPGLLSMSTSDAEGYADLYKPAAENGFILRARGPEHLPYMRENVVVQPGVVCELVVSLGASLSGHVELHGMPAQDLGLQLYVVATRRNRPIAPLQADGKFDFTALPEGEVELRLCFHNTVRTEHGGSTGFIICDPPLARLTLDSKQPRTVACDAARFVPGRLQARVFLDGAPASPARVLLVADRGWHIGQFATDPEGHVLAPRLVPGRYRLDLVIGDFKTGPGLSIHSDERFTIEPGKTVTRTFHFERRRLRVRIVETDGKTPVCNARVLAYSRNGVFDRKTDEAGWLTFDPAPAGRVRIQVVGLKDGMLGPVEIPPGRKQAELTLRLPKR